MNWRAILIIGLLTAGVSGCGTTPPTRYLTLAAIPPSASGAQAGDGLLLLPPTVRWPAALDRLEVAQPGGGVEVTVPALSRWSAAPARLAEAALTADLVTRLPGLTLAPGFAVDAATVDVEVEAISARPDGYGMLAVVTTARGRGAPRRHLLSLQAAGAHAPDGEAQALSQMIAALADQVASDLSAGVSATAAAGPTANRRPTP